MALLMDCCTTDNPTTNENSKWKTRSWVLTCLWGCFLIMPVCISTQRSPSCVRSMWSEWERRAVGSLTSRSRLREKRFERKFFFPPTSEVRRWFCGRKGNVTFLLFVWTLRDGMNPSSTSLTKSRLWSEL